LLCLVSALCTLHSTLTLDLELRELDSGGDEGEGVLKKIKKPLQLNFLRQGLPLVLATPKPTQA